MNGTYKKKKSESTQTISKMKSTLNSTKKSKQKSFDLQIILDQISKKSTEGLSELMKGIEKVTVDQHNLHRHKIKVNVNINNANRSNSELRHDQSNIESNPNHVPSAKSTKQKLAELQQFRRKAATRHSKHKSLKKDEEAALKEEQKKVERIKEINKRKYELMERLKKLDAELTEVKREQSSSLGKSSKIDEMLLDSKVNKSFLRNMAGSRMSRNMENVSVVEQHSKAVSVLQKINNEKIKRQQKIADEFRRKQQEQIKKLQQIEKRKQKQFDFKHKNQYSGSSNSSIYRSKFLNHQKSSAIKAKPEGEHIKINSLNQKYLYQNQFEEKENDVMPMTLMTHKKKEKSIDDDDTFFNEDGNFKNHLLTERNEEVKEERAQEQNTTQNIIKMQVNDQVEQIANQLASETPL